MLAHAPQTGREALGDDQLGEQLRGVGVELLDRRVLVATVEVAQEVAAVAAVEGKQVRCLAQRAGDEADAVVDRQAAGGEPGVALDDVGRDERVLEVERGDVPVGREHVVAQPGRAVLGARLARRALHAGVLDHRREVDLVDVLRPVDRARVEGERGLVVGVEVRPHGEQVVDAVLGLALGVGAVQLDVLERPLDLGLLVLELGRPRGLLAPQRQGLQHPLALGDRLLGPAQLALHPAAAGEAPLGDDDRLALVVVQRMGGEPRAHVVDEGAVLQRVDVARRHLGDARRLLGAEGSDADDGGYDVIDGDHVDRPLGHAGELLQQAAGVGDDHRLGHAEAADPTRPGFGDGRLDDRRAHDRDGHGALRVGERLLAERLGVGVGVGPAQAGGTGPTRIDQLVGDPSGAELLGLGGERRGAGGAELPAGERAELDELGRQPARRFGVRLHPTGSGDLDAPVEPKVERAFRHQGFRRRAAAVAGDVTGGHRHEMRRDAELVEGGGDAHRTEEVDLDRLVERRVEAHGGGRVDDEVARRERRPVGR